MCGIRTDLEKNKLVKIALEDECPKCSSKATGFVVSNSVSYIALKGLHGGTETLKCEECGLSFHSSTYSYTVVTRYD